MKTIKYAIGLLLAVTLPINAQTHVNSKGGGVDPIPFKTKLGLQNVNNTSDADKPISAATQTALNFKVSNLTTVNGQPLTDNVLITEVNSATAANTATGAYQSLNTANDFFDFAGWGTPVFNASGLTNVTRLLNVSNATTRKTLATYAPGPRVGTDRVIQSDLPGILWHLIASDVTLDASWIPVPITNNSGEIVGPIIGNRILETDTTTVPALGEQVAIVDSLTAHNRAEIRVGDGVTVKGRGSDAFKLSRNGVAGTNNGGSGAVGAAGALPTVADNLFFVQNGNGGANGASGQTGSGGAGGGIAATTRLFHFAGGNGGAASSSGNGGAGSSFAIDSGGVTRPVFEFLLGNGGASTGAGNGGNGSSWGTARFFAVQGGNGGVGSAGNGGNGGNIFSSGQPIKFTVGNGGNGSTTGTGVGGNGGQLNPVIQPLTGNGGAGAGNFNGGNGGSNGTFTAQGGAGGAANTTGGNGGTGTAGGSLTLNGGAGGAADAAAAGGTGGSAGIWSANGGSGAAGSVAGGRGGNITMQGGGAATNVAGAAAGDVITSASASRAGGTLNLSAGASVAGGSINLSNGQNIVTINAVAGEMGHRVAVPANTAASGANGQWSSDATYLYYFVSGTGWMRVAGSTF